MTALLLVAAASAQFVETTIRVPDTLCCQRMPEAIAYDTVDSRVYVGGDSNYLLAIDPAVNRRTAKVEVGRAPQVLSWMPSVNKVFAYCISSNELSIVECSRNREVARLPLSSSVYLLCANLTDNKVYALDYPKSLAVFDAVDNHRDTTLWLGHYAHGMCWDPVHDRLYVSCAVDSILLVIDCATNEIVDGIGVAPRPRELWWHPGNGCVYVNHDCESLLVVDTEPDTVVARIGTWTQGARFCSNVTDNKVYLGGDFRDIAVIDGATHQIAGTIPQSGAGTERLFWDRNRDRLYEIVRQNDSIRVFDGASDSLKAALEVHGQPYAICLSPDGSSLYTADVSSEEVSVIDAETLRETARVGIRSNPYAACFARGPNKAFVGCHTTRDLTAIDGATNTIAAVIPLEGNPVALACDSSGAKVYVACGDSLVRIIDGYTNEVIARVDCGDSIVGLLYCPWRGKVYCSDAKGNRLSVIDGRGDTLLRRSVALPAGPAAMCYNYSLNRVCCVMPRGYGLAVVDARADTLIDTVFSGSLPSGVCWDSVHNKYFVARYNGIDVIEGNSNLLIDRVETGDELNSPVARSADGLVYFALPWAGAVLAVDGATHRRAHSIVVPGRPWSLLAPPEGDRLYAACMDGAVGVIDCGRHRLALSVPTGSGTFALTWNEAYGRLYAANLTAGTVSVIRDTLTGIEEAPGGLRVEDVAPTVVRGVLRLTGPANGALYDMSGRRRAELRPGPNDLRRLPAGVYFLLHDSAGPTTKVILQR